MRRLHLFEFGDLPWFPQTLRAAGTEYLRVVSRLVGAHRHLAPLVTRAIEESGATTVVDLCSGAGGPWRELRPLLAERGHDVTVMLTDLRPDPGTMARAVARDPRLHHHPAPVDAACVPPELRGLRTIFNGFHHFDRRAARAVLANAVEAGRPIAVYELSDRSAKAVLGSLLAPAMVWLTGPLLRPVRPLWLLLIYPLPVLPLVTAWDGLVSNLRTWSLPELDALTAGLDGFVWETGREPAGAFHVTWLHGRPA